MVLADESSSVEDKCHAWFNKGIALLELEQPSQAKQQFESILSELEAPKEIQHDAHYQIGIIYYEQSSPGLAKKSLESALEGFMSISANNNTAKTHILLGKIFQSRFDHEQTDFHWNEALNIFSLDNNRIMMAETMVLIADNSLRFDAIHQAENAFIGSLKIYEELSLRDAVHEIASELFNLYLGQYRYDDALYLVRDQYEECVTFGDYSTAIKYLENESTIHALKLDWTRSISIQEQAVSLTKLYNESHLPNVKFQLGRLLLQSGDTQEAEQVLLDVHQMSVGSSDLYLQRQVTKSISELYQGDGRLNEAYVYLLTADSINWLLASAKMEELQTAIDAVEHSETDRFTERDFSSSSSTWISAMPAWILPVGILVMTLTSGIILVQGFRRRRFTKELNWKNYRRIRELRAINKDLHSQVAEVKYNSRKEIKVIQAHLSDLRSERYSKKSAMILNEILDSVVRMKKLFQMRIDSDQETSVLAMKKKGGKPSSERSKDSPKPSDVRKNPEV
jgi:tetratricopeptide (TPR) repeat protein